MSQPPLFIIRTVPERVDTLAAILRELPDAIIVRDRCRDAMDTFLRALDAAGDSPAVHIEDDAILCPRFRERAQAEIAERPDACIQFFSMRRADLTVGSRWDRDFMMAIAFYLPAGWSAELREYAETWPRRAEHPTGVDTMVGDWLRSRRRPHWIVVPNLADHAPVKSAIDPRRRRNRQSLTFGRSA
jgi:hypothetical protein